MSLRTSYGSIKLQKGSILYHYSNKPLYEISNEIPFLYMTLHPSEWFSNHGYITTIELERDVTLLFMVKQIHKLRVYSSLNNYLGVPNSNLMKRDSNMIKCWIPYLVKENLDGWFSSIENKLAVEFVILSDPSVLKIMKTEPIRVTWYNANYNSNMELIPKNWGTTYAISFFSILILNSRFKEQIDSYLQQIKEEDPDGTIFSILLQRSIIYYIDAPLEEIKWCR